MPTPLEARERLKEEFREYVADFITDEKIGQKVIADRLGIKQCSVSRIFGYSGDLNLDVADVPMLSGELLPLANAILNWQAHKLGLNVLALPPAGKEDGTLIDELLSLDAAQGRIAELLKDGLQFGEIKECRRAIAKIMVTLGVMTEQLDIAEKEALRS
jgi:hypothetical protein